MKLLRKLLFIIFLFPSLCLAGDYWEVRVRNVDFATFLPLSFSIPAAMPAGVANVFITTHDAATNTMIFGVAGDDLSSFKSALRSELFSAFGELPSFDVVREDPDEMGIKARVCNVSEAETYNPKFPAYFGSDLRGLGDSPYQNWLEPGNSYCHTRTGLNCDGSAASDAAVDSSLTTWGNMNQCNRWRIRLHHEGEKWDHDTLAKIHIYFANVPQHRGAALRACLTPSEFEFLGQTRADACQKLNNRQAGLCGRFTGF